MPDFDSAAEMRDRNVLMIIIINETFLLILAQASNHFSNG